MRRQTLVSWVGLSVLVACGSDVLPEGQGNREGDGGVVDSTDGDGGVVVDPGCVAKDSDPFDDQGVDDNCDGVDGVKTNIVFVNPAITSPTARGTADDPVGTLKSALEIAGKENKAAVFVCSGTLRENVVIDKRTGFMLRGGLRCSDWRLDGEPTRLEPAAGQPLRIVDSVQVTIEGIHAKATDAVEPGASSVAAAVVRSRDVVLRRLELQAGKGAAGDDGADAPAAPATPTTPASADGKTIRTQLPPPASQIMWTYSGGVAQSCGEDPSFPGVEVTSGAGGRGGATERVVGDRGNDASDGARGGRWTSSTQFTQAEAGDAGAPGAAAQRTESLGELDDGFIVAHRVDGRSGRRGGAGGGGAPGRSPRVCDGSSVRSGAGPFYEYSWVCRQPVQYFLRGGGSGGAGGCGGVGGAGGQGGLPGGSSIALVIDAADVSLSKSSLQVSTGGSGGGAGKGAAGRPGAAGGKSAEGGNEQERWEAREPGPFLPLPNLPGQPPRSQNQAGAAGQAGGAGGAGGRGSDGAPGNGGASLGIYAPGSSPRVAEDVTFTLGAGGQGGAAASAADPAGDVGAVANLRTAP